MEAILRLNDDSENLNFAPPKVELTSSTIIVNYNGNKIEIEKKKFIEAPAITVHKAFSVAGIEISEKELKSILEAINCALEEEKKGTPVNLEELNAGLYGKRIRCKAYVVGTGPLKLLPKIIAMDGQSYELSNPDNWLQLETYFAIRRNKKLREAHGLAESDEKINLYELYVRPALDITKTYNERSYKTYKVLLIGKEEPLQKSVEIFGVLAKNGADEAIMFAYDIKPLNEIFNITITEEDHALFKQYFSKPIKEFARDNDNTIANWIVGRRLAKLTAALVLHSPLMLPYNGKLEFSALRSLFYGESTTGKSEIQRGIDKMQIPSYVISEIARRTGLAGTVDNENNVIIWGVLPENDRGYVGLDGLQALSETDLLQLREAIRQGTVEIRMKVSGKALARTRIIATANPRENSLSNYVYKAQALLDCRPFSDPTELTRWDLYVPFVADDVSAEAKAKAHAHKPAIPFEIYRKHVFFAWQLEPDDILFTNEALATLEKAYIKLLRYKSSEVPIVHDGIKFTLFKLAASFAILLHNVYDTKDLKLETFSKFLSTYQFLPDYQKKMHSSENSTVLNSASTDKNSQMDTQKSGNLVQSGNGTVIKTNEKKVVVEAKHVHFAVALLLKLARMWELDKLVEESLEKRKLTEEEISIIESKFEENVVAKEVFLLFCKRNGLTADQIAGKLDRARNWIIQNIMPVLKGLDLIETSERKKGYWLTAKGKAYAHYLMKKREKAKTQTKTKKQQQEQTSPETAPPEQKDEQNLVHGLCRLHFKQLPTNEFENYEYHDTLGWCDACGRKVIGIYIKRGEKQ